MLQGFAKNLKYNGFLIKDFKNPTKEMCLTAVRQNGLALEFIYQQTDEICMAAVRQNGLAIKFVKNQTESICVEAYKQNPESLSYIRDKKMRQKISQSSSTMILHPDMDIDMLIEEMDKIKTTKPSTGNENSQKQLSR